jgi:hypothetical protein
MQRSFGIHQHTSFIDINMAFRFTSLDSLTGRFGWDLQLEACRNYLDASVTTVSFDGYTTSYLPNDVIFGFATYENIQRAFMNSSILGHVVLDNPKRIIDHIHAHSVRLFVYTVHANLSMRFLLDLTDCNISDRNLPLLSPGQAKQDELPAIDKRLLGTALSAAVTGPFLNSQRKLWAPTLILAGLETQALPFPPSIPFDLEPKLVNSNRDSGVQSFREFIVRFHRSQVLGDMEVTPGRLYMMGVYKGLEGRRAEMEGRSILCKFRCWKCMYYIYRTDRRTAYEQSCMDLGLQGLAP